MISAPRAPSSKTTWLWERSEILIIGTDSPSREAISGGIKVYTMTPKRVYAQLDLGGRGKAKPYFYFTYDAHHWRPTQGGYALEETEADLLYNDLGQTTRGPKIIYKFGETLANTQQIENFRDKIRQNMSAAQAIPGANSRIGLRIPDDVVRSMVSILRSCLIPTGTASNFTMSYGFKEIVFDLQHFSLV